MSIEGIGALGATDAASLIAADAPRSTAIGRGPDAADFLATIGEGVGRVDGSLKAADVQLRALAAGDEVALHDVMIAMERARIDLTLIAEVRNRIVESYQELIRMQL